MTRVPRTSGALVCCIGVLACAAASTATAAVVTNDPDTGNTTFTAAPGEVNHLEVEFTTLDDDDDPGTPELPVIEYHDFGAIVTSPSDYCTPGGDHFVYCVRDDDLDSLATIVLGDKDDILRQGSPGRDAAYGGAGDDLLVGRSGDDLIDGGAGDDTLEDPEWAGCGDQGGSLGADRIVGGAGVDELKNICRSGSVRVSLDGRANDGLADEGDNVAGDIEVIEGPGNHDSLYFVGNDLPNVARGGGASSVLIGNGGDDELYGGVGNDKLDGGPGDDIVEGWGGADTVDGGPGSDDLSGEGGSTMTDGTGGADTILARDGFADTISCGTRADRAIVDRFDIVPQAGGADTCEAVETDMVDAPPTSAQSSAQPPPTPVPAPAPSPAPRPAPAPLPVVKPTLSLGTRSARVGKGRFGLRLSCNGSTRCIGALDLRAGRRPIGSARLALAPGGSKTIRIVLNRTGRRLLRRRRSLKVVVTLKLHGQPTRHVGMTLRRGGSR